MFDPMFNDPTLDAIPLVLAVIGFAVGFYWIYRSWKDIEDN
jgi:hypothetical protein